MQRLSRLAREPAAQLVAGAVALVLAFPGTASATIGWSIVCGAIGVGVATWWPQVPRHVRMPPRWFVLIVVAALGLVAFWDVLVESPGWQLGDWGPKHAVLAGIMPSLPGLDVPVWNHALATGDAPLELYPAATYLVTGHLALVLGLEHDLPLAFMIVAAIVHVGLAVTTTMLALRIASKPVALVVGTLFLLDGGAISHGGVVGLFHWAILDSALAHVFSMIATLGVLAALARPRIGRSVAIWIATAAATACHPAALLTAVASMIALVAVALLATDVPPRRAIAAIGHLALGVLLGAVVWLPAGERLLAYGQHFSNELYSTTRLLQFVMQAALPISSYSLVVASGYLGIAAGLWGRRAGPVFVAVVAIVLFVGLCDGPYLGLGIASGPMVARLGATRMMMLVRPFVYAAAALALTLIGGRVRGAWRGASRRQRSVGAALVGAIVGSLVRIAPIYWRDESERAFQEARVTAADRAGRDQLVAWAHDQMRTVGPGSWARALFEQHTHEQAHLTAVTGLPTLHLETALPDLMLRERIEDSSPASLARFDVRWVIGVDKSPTLGDEQTEITLGSFHIRELPAWDGKLARIERGAGEVHVLRLDDRAVEIELAGTTEPALVALGTGYYPRWRARHATGADEPVYAFPSIPGGQLHVVAAWVAPGRTTFTVDGPLPSDGHGRWWSIGAALIAIAAILAWRRPTPILRRIARLRVRVRPLAPWCGRLGVPLVLAMLAVRGCASGPARAFVVGNGLRATATVQARMTGGTWQDCEHAWLTGEYRCVGLATVNDGTANIVNDASPSWPFTTAAVIATADRDDIEVRVTRTLELAGRYWAAAAGGTATLSVGEDEQALSDQGGAAPAHGARSIALDHQVTIEDDGKRVVQFTGRVPPTGKLELVLVRVDTLEPPRPFLDGPPDTPPPTVAAIHP